jgi:hypothetical protein
MADEATVLNPRLCRMTRVRFALLLALSAGLSSENSLAAPARPRASAAPARATPPRRAPARSTRKPPASPGAAKPAAAPPAATPTTARPAEAAAAATPSAEAGRARAPASGTSEAKVAPAAPPAETGLVKTEEAEKGVKTYTFGAEEVEGRLRSPQILYFLRRVRAEFDAEPLGHRSFLLELSDTRRDPSLQ